MTDHATNVLYPKIKRAMGLLDQLPAGESAILDEAYNALHDAYWSETPAPASASHRREVGESVDA